MEHAQPVQEMVSIPVGASYVGMLCLLFDTALLSLTEEINHPASSLLPTLKLSLAEDDKDGILGPVRSHCSLSERRGC